MTLEEIEKRLCGKGSDCIECNEKRWLISRVKELEAVLADTINGQGKRILELEEGIRKHKKAECCL